MGNCFSAINSNDKKLQRTDTNGNELQRTASSYQGNVAESMRYSDRQSATKGQTASELHKSRTLEERIRQAEHENRSRVE
ncbi:hypothetical protein MCUN1_000188 [Malassezia cuniculi]|uniref:Uncharacterized protein n=1 Tax=Malassezia cuniculi TaxID=948313 RepID=A0AAF0J4T3_9BASI|nr:hypothetical protein MCUN1_000188 [Malassezia cuniculi]